MPDRRRNTPGKFWARVDSSRGEHACSALSDALNEDARELQEHGFYNGQQHEDTLIRLGEVLGHYASTSEPLDEAEAWA